MRKNKLIQQVKEVCKEHNLMIKDGMEYVLTELYREHDILWDNDRLVQSFDCMKDIKVMRELIKNRL